MSTLELEPEEPERNRAEESAGIHAGEYGIHRGGHDTPEERRETLDEALARGMELGKVGGTPEYNASLEWKTVNDGTKPDNSQVYQLHSAGGAFAGWSVRGPHVGGET